MARASAAPRKPAKPPRAGRTAEYQAELDARVRWALRSYAPADVERMDDEAVLGLKASMDHGQEMHLWETLEKYMPVSTPGKRRIDLREQVLRYLPSEQQQAIRAALGARKRALPTAALRLFQLCIGKMVRLMLVMRFGPAGLGKSGGLRPLDVTTIATAATHALPQLFALALRKHLEGKPRAPSDQNFLAILDSRDIDYIPAASRGAVLLELGRLQALLERGVWSDVVREIERTDATTNVTGDAPKQAPERTKDPHLPLPDDYVSEMGVHCHWLIEEFAPSMLALADQVDHLWRRTEDLSVTSGAVGQRRHDQIKELLAGASFRDSKGQQIVAPPFRSVQAPWWPMRTYRDFVFGMRLVQMAHYFIVGLPLAGRKSELGTLKRDCIKYTETGEPYANGRTWKLVERIEGVQREYQLPDFSAYALEQQLRLVNLMERIGRLDPARIKLVAGNHLWAEMGTGKADCRKPLLHASYALQWFADALGMSKEPDGQGIRVHRFRKTIARLAALAMSDAPKVLMDVFGHRDIEMTLHYILTDPDLQADTERVEREMRVAKVRVAVTTIVDEEQAQDALPQAGWGGPFAPVLEASVREYKVQLHRQGKEWGVDTVEEFVQLQTLGGKAGVVVRPGVMCMKFPLTEAGPCNKSKGQPDRARCQSHCGHRLEAPFLRQDVDSSIRRCVQGFMKEKAAGQDLVQTSWVVQLKVHLPRFPDLREKWLLTPEVQEMLAFEEDEEATA